MASFMANDGAWYAQATLEDDASVLSSFETYVHGLSQSSLQSILSLYPESDFTHMVQPNEEATAQYYRAAQINRDLLFTCPVIDFTWQYTRYGASQVRIYEMNQTKYGPIYQNIMGVPQWRVSHLSDIPYVMNEDVAAGGDNSAAQKRLSSYLSGSAAAFAHSGEPTISRGRSFKDWPNAYSGQNAQALENDYPKELNLYVVGGPYGSGPATITSGQSNGSLSVRDEALAWEKVINRCRFINSIQNEIGV